MLHWGFLIVFGSYHGQQNCHYLYWKQDEITEHKFYESKLCGGFFVVVVVIVFGVFFFPFPCHQSFYVVLFFENSAYRIMLFKVYT